MRKPTLSDIRAHNLAEGHHFFDRKTMKFFGDTMRSLRAVHEYGRVFVVRVRGRNAGKRWEYFADTGDVRSFTDAAPMYSTFDELDWSRRWSKARDFHIGDRVYLHEPNRATHAATVHGVSDTLVHVTLDASPDIRVGVPAWKVIFLAPWHIVVSERQCRATGPDFCAVCGQPQLGVHHHESEGDDDARA